MDFIINEKDIYRVDIVNGECIIPDEFLQKSGYHTVYECMSDYTIRNHMFPVHPREKPPTYVYTPTEKLTFEGLVQKVNDTVADIIHRADTGEFDGYTPVKGKDYFTNAEKAEMMESVSSGAVGEFRKVVDTATAEYNANAYENLTAYDTNAEQRTSDYNRNAAEKLEAYNQNHTEKVAEYNQNAETKTAEFDANAAALQTEVDRLRGECDTLAAENRKQENRIDALIKLNKGQTYDIIPEDGETASRTAPSGAKYVSVDKVGGKSVVWNQHFDFGTIVTTGGQILTNGVIDVYKDHVYIFIVDNSAEIDKSVTRKGIHWNYSFSIPIAYGSNVSYVRGRNYFINTCKETQTGIKPSIWYAISGVTLSNLMLIDLTQMFGSGNEPTLEECKQIFSADYYPYSEPTIISSQTDRVDVASADGTTSQQITTGFPVLNSAGSVYDYIDLNEGKLHKRVGVVDLGTLNWKYSELDGWHQVVFKNRGRNNLLCDRYKTDNYTLLNDKTIWCNSSYLVVVDTSYTDGNALKQALQGVMLYYELAEPIITDITIPTELTEWLEVEAGGTVTFKNADESKQLAVPNAVSWVRKLDEVN